MVNINLHNILISNLKQCYVHTTSFECGTNWLHYVKCMNNIEAGQLNPIIESHWYTTSHMTSTTHIPITSSQLTWILFTCKGFKFVALTSPALKLVLRILKSIPSTGTGNTKMTV